jgi:hypothetical protein
MLLIVGCSFQEQRQFEELHMAIEYAMNRQRVASVASPEGYVHFISQACRQYRPALLQGIAVVYICIGYAVSERGEHAFF